MNHNWLVHQKYKVTPKKKDTHDLFTHFRLHFVRPIALLLTYCVNGIYSSYLCTIIIIYHIVCSVTLQYPHKCKYYHISYTLHCLYYIISVNVSYATYNTYILPTIYPFTRAH